MKAAATPAPESINKCADTAFAFITLFLGYALARTAIFCEPGVGVTLYALIFVFAAGLYMRLNGVVISPSTVVPPAIMLVFSAVFVISGMQWVRLLTLVFEVMVAVYWFLAAFGCRAEDRLGDYLPFDLVKAFFVQPFASFFEQPKTAAGALKSTKTGRNIFYVIVGLALGAVPAAVITVTLMASDDAFESLINILFNAFLSSVWLNILYFMFGLPIAMYLFGMMTSASSRKCKKILTAEQCGRFLRTAGFVPPAVIYTALSVILVIYALFFVSQSSYFLSAFASLLPEGYTFADYARRGFFELCRVATINALLVLCAEIFIKREPADGAEAGKANRPLGLRVLNVLMGASTLVLFAVAGAKLYLYIENYGLTPARVSAAWIMLLLAFMFVFLIVRQIAPKFNFWRASTVAFVVLFAALSFSNFDTLIAKYNIARFYDGSLQAVDVYLFGALSDAALPELAELLERDEASGGQLLEYEARLWATEHLQNRLWNAEGKRSAAGGSITDRINYLLGYNASRRTALRLVDAGK